MSKLTDTLGSAVESIGDFLEYTVLRGKVDRETVAGLAILAALVAPSWYCVRDQTLHNVTVEETGRDIGYCGDGMIECYNQTLTFEGVEGCFEDQSLDGCYLSKDHNLLEIKPGEVYTEVTFRNPILPPWGCYVITETDPSKEEQAGRGTFWDWFMCGFR